MKNKKGFTLIELMIVVAIIGILAALAIPDFMKMMCKAKQSEAKTNLAAVFTNQELYHGDNNTYSDQFGRIGFDTEGENIYTYWIGANSIQTSGMKGGVPADCQAAPGAVGVERLAFTAAACGNVDNDSPVDVWKIDDAKHLETINDDCD